MKKMTARLKTAEERDKEYWFKQFRKYGVKTASHDYSEYKSAKMLIALENLTPSEYDEAIQYAAEYVGV